MKFFGYKRNDGSVGIRNKVFILPASICASDVARKIAEQVDGAVTFHNLLGCSQTRDDQACTISTMAGMAANPNVYGTILISLGCENCQMKLVKEAIRERSNKPLETFIIQDCGGTLATIKQAVRAARDMVISASNMHREVMDFSNLIIGTECGGSDPTSGLVANPLVGELTDLIVKEGGTSILSETTEFIGAEHILAKRAINEDVAKKLLNIVFRYKDSMHKVCDDVRTRNPSPGNISGGITTLEEKSLGCVFKSGHTKIKAVFDYAEKITKNGLVIMDTPGNDPISITGMVAGGCHMVLFTTGRGTPTGNPIVPVIKISGNRKTSAEMKDNIDFDASPLIFGERIMEDVKLDLLKEVIEVANGKLTRSEVLGYFETAIARVGRYIQDDLEEDGRHKIGTYYY